jgi:hypothetical protein
MQRIDAFHQTRLGHFVFGLVELALAYVLALKALDTGNLIIWTLTIILLVGFLQNMVRMVGVKK